MVRAGKEMMPQQDDADKCEKDDPPHTHLREIQIYKSALTCFSLPMA